MANSLRNRTIKIDDGCHTAVMGSMENISTILGTLRFHQGGVLQNEFVITIIP